MSALLIRFKIELANPDFASYEPHYGPLFHRWLPDGDHDAIVLKTDDPNLELKVWFERRGFVENGNIQYSPSRFEVDPAVHV
jgi:hypothetical protein